MRDRVPYLFLQSDGAECGLACVAYLCRLLRQPVSLQDLRQRYGGAVRGVSLENLIALGERLGIRLEANRYSGDSIDRLRAPAILLCRNSHFVVLVGRRNDQWVIFNPHKGLLSLDDRQAHALFQGVALEARVSAKPEKCSGKGAAALRAHGALRSCSRLLGPLLHWDVLPWPMVAACAPWAAALICAAWPSVFAASRAEPIWCVAAILGADVARRLGRLPNSILVRRYRHHALAGAAERLRLQAAAQRPSAYVGDRFRVEGEPGADEDRLPRLAADLTLDGPALVSACVGLAYLSPLAALQVFAGIGAWSVLAWRLGGRRREAGARVRHCSNAEVMRRIEILKSPAAISPIVAHGLVTRWASKMRSAYDDRRATEFADHAIDLGASLVFAGAVLWIASAQQWPTSALALVLGLSAYAWAAATELLGNWMRYGPVGPATTAPSQAATSARPVSPPPSDPGVAVSVRNLCFRHHVSDRWLFRGVDFDVKAGEVAAVAGGSGAGKSTLLNILAGRMQPEAGRVLYGEGMIAETVGGWVEGVELIQREDCLYAGTIAENVGGFGEPPDRARVWRCLTMVGIGPWVSRLPMGIHSYVGLDGQAFSAGERQRLLIARSLYAGPRLLLLDDATSSLDPHSERQIIQALRQAGLTVILTSHRRLTLDLADRVLELARLRTSANRSALAASGATDCALGRPSSPLS